MGKTEETLPLEPQDKWGELLQHVEQEITQAPEVTQEVDRVEAWVRDSILGVPLPGILFYPGNTIEKFAAIREAAANHNDPKLTKEKAA